MNENDAGLLIGRAMVFTVVDQHVAGLHMLVLVARHAGDDRHAWKMLGRPFDLLRRGPTPERQTGEDCRLEMRDPVEQ